MSYSSDIEDLVATIAIVSIGTKIQRRNEGIRKVRVSAPGRAQPERMFANSASNIKENCFFSECVKLR
eukprot:IDg1676t1